MLLKKSTKRCIIILCILINIFSLECDRLDAYISRRPVFDVGGNVFAYELRFKITENDEKNLAVCGSEPTNSLFGIDIHRLVGKSRAFIAFSDTMFKANLPLAFSPDFLIVGVNKEQLDNPEIMEICRDLKQRGYMIALGNFEYSKAYDEIFGFADIIEIKCEKNVKSASETAYVCRYSNKLMLASGIDDREKYSYAKMLGCTFMEGFFFAKPDIDPKSGIKPLPASISNAMAIMSKPDVEIQEIVNVLSVDSAVCQRLLRLINSVYFGFTTKISSITQAIVVLGIDYIREWIYLMAVQKITNNENPEATKCSLLMAKFCQKIALFIPNAKKNAESFYLMGLLSLVVFCGEKLMNEALEEFPITNDIKKGLLRKGGIYSDVFEMALSYLSGEWDKYEKIAAAYDIDINTITAGYAECVEEVEKAEMN